MASTSSFALSRAHRALVALTVCIALILGSVVKAEKAAADVTPSAATALSIANNLLNALNAERRYVGRPPLRSNSALIASAHKHNLLMARYNTMSHQLPGELSLGARITRAGYTPWRAVGENVAWNTDWTLAGAYYLQRLMYHEVAPNDGHRQNIISTTYVNVGIDVYMDSAHHKMWITQDFGRLA